RTRVDDLRRRLPRGALPGDLGHRDRPLAMARDHARPRAADGQSAERSDERLRALRHRRDRGHGPAAAPSASAGPGARRCMTWVRAVQLVLLANAVPAFLVLSSFPGRTDDLFVWTVKPDASAQLLAARYGNAALLTLLTLGPKAW